MAQPARVMTADEDDDDLPSGQQARAQGGTAEQVMPSGQPEADGDDTEYEIADDSGDEGGEARLSDAEGGDKPLLEQRRQENVRVYTRDQIAQMTPEERQQAWRALPPEHRRDNRALERQRRKDTRGRAINENVELKRELAEMRNRLNQVDGTVQRVAPQFQELQRGRLQDQIASVSRQLSETDSALTTAEAQVAEAFANQDGALFTRAQAAVRTAERNKAQLEAAKRTLETAAGNAGDIQAQPQQQRQQPQAQPQQQAAPSPRVQSFVAEFMEEFPRFDPNARNQGAQGDFDSRIVSAIDDQLVAEGFQPSTQEYWEELRDRMESRVPSWFEDEQAAPARRQQANAAPQRRQAPVQRRGGPPSLGGGDGGSPSGKVKVKLTAQRKDALVLAGVLDRDGTVLNKDKFTKQLRAYSNYDRENGEVRQ